MQGSGRSKEKDDPYTSFNKHRGSSEGATTIDGV